MASSSSSSPSSASSFSFALPPSLEQARIEPLPATAYYIPDFISKDEERTLLAKISAAPQPKWKQLTHRRLQTWPSDLVQDRLLDAPLPAWLETPIVPRLLCLPLSADEHDTPMDTGCRHVFAESPHRRPNHVLINEYPPGIGIMPHKLSISSLHMIMMMMERRLSEAHPTQDGAAYFPIVCTVSLGASLCLNLHRSKEDGALDPEPVARILQEPRSLLITADSLYSDFLHGISDLVEDVDLCADNIANWSLLRDAQSFASGRNVRQTRTSLTFRDVLKVSNVGHKLRLFRKP